MMTTVPTGQASNWLRARSFSFARALLLLGEVFQNNHTHTHKGISVPKHLGFVSATVYFHRRGKITAERLDYGAARATSPHPTARVRALQEGPAEATAPFPVGPHRPKGGEGPTADPSGCQGTRTRPCQTGQGVGPVETGGRVRATPTPPQPGTQVLSAQTSSAEDHLPAAP